MLNYNPENHPTRNTVKTKYDLPKRSYTNMCRHFKDADLSVFLSMVGRNMKQILKIVEHKSIHI